MSIKHTQLRAFHEVAAAGSFSAASREMGLTQPALTMQVRALESSFGVELFRRSGREIAITDSGITLQKLTHRYFAIAREAEQYLRDVGEFRSGEITLAADGPVHIMPILGAIRRGLPNIKVHVSFGNSTDVVRALTNYEAHLGYSSRTGFGEEIEVLRRERHEIVLMVSREHSLGRRRNIRLEELKNEMFVLRESGSSTRAIFQQALNRADIQPEIAIEIANQTAVQDAVANGLGIGVVQKSEFNGDERLRTISFSDEDLYAEECLICMRDRIGTPLMDAVIESLDL